MKRQHNYMQIIITLCNLKTLTHLLKNHLDRDLRQIYIEIFIAHQ